MSTITKPQHVYRTKSQKEEARRTAYRFEGTWRSDAPFCIHGEPGVYTWDAATHKVPVRLG